MKIEIVRYVARCDTCKRVKATYMKTAGLLQSTNTNMEMGRYCMDFIVGLTRTTKWV